MTLAPWLHGTDILGALQAGSHVGLSARQADQRDAEMQQQAELAAAHQQAAAQEAAARLREHYDALAQVKELALRDDDYRSTHDAAKLLQDKTEADALALYRAGLLKNGEARIGANQNKPFQGKGHFTAAGDYFKEVEPGVVKQLFTAPAKPAKAETTPAMSLRLDPDNPQSPLFRLPINHPLINQLMGTNAPPGTGTNYVAPLPKVAPKVAPVPPASGPGPTAKPPEFKKGMRVRQDGKTYEFDGKSWSSLDEEPVAEIADAEGDPGVDTLADDEEA